MLINKNQYSLLKYQEQDIKLILCKNEHILSEICDEILNGKKLNVYDWLIVSGIVAIIIVLILIVYKNMMKIRMRKEMRGEVKNTLEQYYRYMETL